MRQAIAHLVALGHGTIAWVGGPKTSWSSAHRSIGLFAAAHDHGVRLIDVGHFAPTYEGGMAAADQAVATGATAVVAYNDLVAIGLLARLHARGIEVPEALSVVGIDDIAMSRMSRPALTTVRLPKQKAGEIAVELLLALLDDPDSDSARTQGQLLLGELIVRDSTGVAHDLARP
jgi:LacI family transcriptional regulator/LacI family repressor for deo operon, udp, cdd, tsx, nupC, and nupG